MNLVRLRNGKARFVAGVGGVTIFLIVTFVMHDTHTKLVSTRSLVHDCDHKRESLAAQLQVTFEHKSRLEKALQQEKLAHTHMKDKLESQYEELQDQMDKEKQEANRKYSTILQQKEALQNQQETLYKEFSSLQQTNAELQEEKQNLLNKMTSQLDQLRMTKDEELLQLQNAFNKLQKEKEDLAVKFDKNTLLMHQLETDLNVCKDASKALEVAVKSPLKGYLTENEKKTATVKPLPIIEHPIPADIPLVKLDSDIKHESAHHNSLGVKLDANNNIHQEEQRRVVPPPPDIVRSSSRVSPSKVEPIADANEGHQLAIPAVDVVGMKDENGRQVEDPNQIDHNVKKSQHIVEPPPVALEHGGGREIHQKSVHIRDHVDEHLVGFRRDADLVANGLEQQENGGDQDLDDIENDVEIEKRDINRFEDNDFDQDDNDGNRANNPPPEVRHEGVIIAPHK